MGNGDHPFRDHVGGRVGARHILDPDIEPRIRRQRHALAIGDAAAHQPVAGLGRPEARGRRLVPGVEQQEALRVDLVALGRGECVEIASLLIHDRRRAGPHGRDDLAEGEPVAGLGRAAAHEVAAARAAHAARLVEIEGDIAVVDDPSAGDVLRHPVARGQPAGRGAGPGGFGPGRAGDEECCGEKRSRDDGEAARMRWHGPILRVSDDGVRF